MSQAQGNASSTPGPWLVSGATVYALHGEPKRNRFFTQVQRGRSDDASYAELIANARLIAAAPEQHELLAIFAEWARQVAAREDVPRGIRSAAAGLAQDGRLLLAKATGAAA